MNVRKMILSAAAAGATVVVIATGTAAASPATTAGSAVAAASTVAAPSTSSSAALSATGTVSQTTPNNPGDPGKCGPGRGKHHEMGTAVTGAELTKVTAAIKAKDSAVTVTRVAKGPKGNYLAIGTKAGHRVRVEASADLKTITVKTGGPATGTPGKGKHHAMGTTVTGAELTKVTAAIKTQDPKIAVTKVDKGPKDNYRAVGTIDGKPVRIGANASLKNITIRTGPVEHRRAHHDKAAPVTGAELTKVTAAIKAKDAAVTVTRVEKGPKGNYRVLGTKAGTAVHLTASADLKTIIVDTGRPGC